MKLQTSFSRQVKVKYYFNEGFHPKLFIFEHNEVTTVIVGSSNLTWQGLNINVEANVMLTRPIKSDFIISVQNYFKNLLDYAASDLETAFRQYDKMFKRFSNQQKGVIESGDEGKFSKTNLPPQFFESRENIQQLSLNCKVLWKIAPGKRGYEWNEWINSSGIGRIAIGWDESNEIGRLSDYKCEKDLKNNIETHRKNWSESWNELGERGGQKDPSWYVAKQLWRFYDGTKKGNLVIAYSNKTIYALGIINGDYDYVKDSKFFCHRKSVKWLAVPRLRITLELSKKIGFRQTIFPVESSSIIKEVFQLILNK